MDQFDPFGLRPMRLFDLDIIEAKQRPRYEMPEWLVPGVVRWDPKMRDETNEWARWLRLEGRWRDDDYKRIWHDD